MKTKLLIGTLLLFSLASCYSSRKAKINAAVNDATQQQTKEAAVLKDLEINKSNKLKSGNIDSSINYKIESNLTEAKSNLAATNRIAAELSSSVNNKKTFRKNFKSIIKSKIVYLRNTNQGFEKRLLNYGIINEGLNKAEGIQFDLATFFGSGEYLIPAGKIEQARSAFVPIVDSILKFGEKYPSTTKAVTIVLKGYADATGIAQGSTLFYRLCNELRESNPSNSSLNLALSKLRTESISLVVNKILQSRQPDFLKRQMVNIELVQEGRGEELPNQAIKDYTDSDARRRIVLFFWNILPLIRGGANGQ
jgi:hypothetical protein